METDLSDYLFFYPLKWNAHEINQQTNEPTNSNMELILRAMNLI